MAILNNRIVYVQPRTPDGDPAPGYHVNVDTRILTDAGTSDEAGALLAAVQPYVVQPATPQFTFGADTQTLCLRFPDEAAAVALGMSFGVSDGWGGSPQPPGEGG